MARKAGAESAPEPKAYVATATQIVRFGEKGSYTYVRLIQGQAPPAEATPDQIKVLVKNRILIERKEV